MKYDVNIIEDEGLFSSLLVDAIQRDGEKSGGAEIGEVREFETPADYLLWRQANDPPRPQILFVDLYIDTTDCGAGFAAARNPKIKRPGDVVWAMSRLDELGTIRGLLDEGVDGYILKNRRESLEEIIRALRAACRNEHYSTEIMDRARMSEVEDSVRLLTDREKEVIGKLLIGGKTPQVVAWECAVGEKYVSKVRKSVRTKLGVREDWEIRDVLIRSGMGVTESAG
ncbi:two component transcriptional regulator, LuxR family (plasmid) [Thioalkalivibrio sp. K90mix]|uniref:helix-turn-helix transcriptional regulator n=1 Tax=Thioalkalivibrio sp. (strain K90mix) TaxID=396595 RepID=UPI000195A727|nr:response regulator transcription factor [Thioalkalivibrio sp. K90mix]ADC73294.1 two component transcriptional regulator, LuxR family [Thioalkalivibrio sp. K90mix]